MNREILRMNEESRELRASSHEPGRIHIDMTSP